MAQNYTCVCPISIQAWHGQCTCFYYFFFNYILILASGVVERTCGSNGVDCFNTCNQMEGPRTERLAIFTGSNPRAQAEQYCADAKAEDSSSRSGYCFTHVTSNIFP